MPRVSPMFRSPTPVSLGKDADQLLKKKSQKSSKEPQLLNNSWRMHNQTTTVIGKLLNNAPESAP
jgi:hypothetical protein